MQGLRRFSTSAAVQRRVAPALPARLAAVAAEGRPDMHASCEVTDRKSRFVAHAARAQSVGEVRAFLDALLEDKRVRRATHPAILAWRVGDESGE